MSQSNCRFLAIIQWAAVQGRLNISRLLAKVADDTYVASFFFAHA